MNCALVHLQAKTEETRLKVRKKQDSLKIDLGQDECYTQVTHLLSISVRHRYSSQEIHEPLVMKVKVAPSQGCGLTQIQPRLNS